MTVNTSNVYELGLLAEVSYALLDGLDKNDPEYNKKLNDMLTKTNEAKLAETQAKDFAANYQIVSHQPNTESGFSATVFKRKHPKEGEAPYIFANRGTEASDMVDVSVDVADIALNGLAFTQIIDMYNYYQHITTPEGQACKQAAFDIDAFNADNPHWNGGIIPDALQIKYTRVSEESDIKGLGIIPKESQFDVAGHSLGGHLSTAFSRLFPDQTQNVVSINGAGYSVLGLSLGESGNINTLFKNLGGNTDFDSNKIINVYGHKGPEFITQDFALKQPGQHIDLFIQDASNDNLFGHGVSQMTDTLAIAKLISQLDQTNTNKNNDSNKSTESTENTTNAFTKINNILMNNKDANAGLESIAARFGDILINDKLSLLKTNDRSALHEQINNIKISALGDTQIISLIGKNVGDLVSLAQSDEAYRYALTHANSFALVGADYSKHNQHAELDLYDINTGKGTLTEAHLQTYATQFLNQTMHAKQDLSNRSADIPRIWQDDHYGQSTHGTDIFTDPKIANATIEVTDTGQILASTQNETFNINPDKNHFNASLNIHDPAGDDIYKIVPQKGLNITLNDHSGQNHITIVKPEQTFNQVTKEDALKGALTSPFRGVWVDANDPKTEYHLSLDQKDLIINSHEMRLTIPNFENNQMGIFLDGLTLERHMAKFNSHNSEQGYVDSMGSSEFEKAMAEDYRLRDEYEAKHPYIMNPNDNMLPKVEGEDLSLQDSSINPHFVLSGDPLIDGLFAGLHAPHEKVFQDALDTLYSSDYGQTVLANTQIGYIERLEQDAMELAQQQERHAQMQQEINKQNELNKNKSRSISMSM